MHINGRRLSVGAWIGLTIVSINLLGVLLAPVIAPYGEADLVGDVWSPISTSNWLGLDNLGRDMFSRLLFGARTTIGIAFAITLLSFAIGITIGFAAAVIGRWIDMALSWLVDALMAIPQLIFALIILSVLGTSIPVLIITIAVLDSTRVFRLSRAVGMQHRGHGLCRGGSAARRETVVDHTARTAPQCLATAHHRIRPAFLLCLFADCVAQLSWARHSAALCRLG